ncbi:MAG: alpha/beta hydrolase [Ginsengibacter sp.]
MIIYKQYTPAALDRQYNNRLQVPEYATHFEGWELMSRQTEKEYPVIKNVPYGNLSRELLDIYPSSQPRSKTLIFIHGGYWQRFDKASFHFVAGAFHSYDIATVILNYPLAPEVSIDQIVLSCRKAVYWLLANLASFNGNADDIYIAGHSAGAHLAAMLMAADWQQANNHPGAFMFKGACAISGLFNLVPVQLCEVNEGLQMDVGTALRNSPVQLKPVTQCPLLLVMGEEETEEFKDQSEELYECWEENISIEFSQIKGLNHFSILEALCDPALILHKHMRRLMKI